jgi:glycosyltransferase involved in cell wall biosynthesis
MALESAHSSQQSPPAAEFSASSIYDLGSSHHSLAVNHIANRNSTDSSPFNLPVESRPLVTIVIPAYNEALILEQNLQLLCDYLRHLETDYRWELVLVNDGSRDDTAALAEAFASGYANVQVIHHFTNMGLGQALRTGFDHAQGDYVITLDLDLSYAPEHIEQLLLKIRQTRAKVVVTSPYMQGGKVSNVPELRRLLSLWANRFLSLAARRNVATLTGMVRVYDARFLDSLNLRSTGMEVNPEVIHKAMLMEERIEEIPAHLSWRSQQANIQADRQAEALPRRKAPRRKSSMKILRHSWAIFYYGFVFRPVMFFIIPSLLFFLSALYCIFWMLVRSWEAYQEISQIAPPHDLSEVVALAFQQAPHTFIIGGMLLMLAIQLFSLGILAVQNKRYFEEIYYLGSSIYRSTKPPRPSASEQANVHSRRSGH